MRWFWLGLLILLIPPVNAAVYINEIMYDPAGSDTDKEWVEIYNDGSCTNISPWYLFEANTNRALRLVQGNELLCAGQFAVIADKNSTFLSEYAQFNGTLFDTSAFSFSNTNETIALKNDTFTVMNSVSYFSQWGGNGDGKSLELIVNNWIPSIALGGTPGQQNGINSSQLNTTAPAARGLKLSANINSPIYLNLSYDNLFKIENLDHVTGQSENLTAALQYNLTKNNVVFKQETVGVSGINSYKTSGTGSFLVNETGTYYLCGEILASSSNDTNSSDNSACAYLNALDPSSIPCNVSLGLDVNQSIFQSGQAIKFKHILNNETFPFTISYWVEDIFGEIAKNTVESSNTNQKSWTPDVDDLEKAFLIKSQLIFTACNDFDKSDNYAEKLVVVKGSGSASGKNPDSSITILDADEEARFGDTINVRLNVYKGDTAAYSITAHVKGKRKVSDDLKFYAYSKFTNYSLRLPIPIYGNCDNDYADGRYSIIISGLNQSASREIMLSGNDSDCSAAQTGSEETSVLSSSSGNFAFSFLSYPERANIGDTVASQVQIEGDEEEHDVEIYSYIRKGSKIYGEKGDNAQMISLPKQSSVTVELSNLVSATDPGNYDLVVKLRKDGQKTEKELKTNIEIGFPSSAGSKTVNVGNTQSVKYKSVKDDPFWWQDRVDESVDVFDSSTEKSRKYISMAVVGMLGMLSLFLLLFEKLTLRFLLCCPAFS